MKLVAFDTGKLTGVCTWLDGDIWSAALTETEVDVFARDKIPLADVVVSERLVISQATIRKGRQVQQAIELVGVVKHYARINGKKHVEQMPAEVMKFVSDKKLKAMGLYVPGPDHQNDARRHAITYLVESGHVNPRVLLQT